MKQKVNPQKYRRGTQNKLSAKLKAVETVLDNSYLVSLDAKHLYTNIPNSDGIKAVKTSLDNFPKKTIATKVITTFLSLILSLKQLCIQL